MWCEVMWCGVGVMWYGEWWGVACGIGNIHILKTTSPGNMWCGVSNNIAPYGTIAPPANCDQARNVIYSSANAFPAERQRFVDVVYSEIYGASVTQLLTYSLTHSITHLV